MKQISLGAFRYWLRINGFLPKWFGGGEKWNPIKIKSKKQINHDRSIPI